MWNGSFLSAVSEGKTSFQEINALLCRKKSTFSPEQNTKRWDGVGCGIRRRHPISSQCSRAHDCTRQQQWSNFSPALKSIWTEQRHHGQSGLGREWWKCHCNLRDGSWRTKSRRSNIMSHDKSINIEDLSVRSWVPKPLHRSSLNLVSSCCFSSSPLRLLWMKKVAMHWPGSISFTANSGRALKTFCNLATLERRCGRKVSDQSLSRVKPTTRIRSGCRAYGWHKGHGQHQAMHPELRLRLQLQKLRRQQRGQHDERDKHHQARAAERKVRRGRW